MNENNNTNNQSNNSFLYNPLTIDNSNEEHENENIPTSSTPNFIPNNNNNPSPIVAPVTPAVSEVNSNDVSSTPNFIPNADKPASPITAPTPEVNSNSEQPNVLNMQPQMMPLSNNESTPNPVGDSQQRDSKFLINQTPNDTNLNLNNTNQEINQQLGIQQEQNRFFDTNASYNETTINDLNVSGNYNHLNKTTDGNIPYANDPKVLENLGKVEKKTVTITPELKIVIIITIAMFIFILIMPYIFDLIRNIK